MAEIPNPDFTVGALAPISLVIAALSLLLAVKYLKRVMAPVGAMFHVMAAAFRGVLAVGVALVLVLAALVAVVWR